MGWAVTAAVVFQEQGLEEGNQECECKGGEPDAGRGAADVEDDDRDGGEHPPVGGRGEDRVEDDDRDGGEHPRVGGRGEDRVDGAGIDVSAVWVGLGTVRGGGRKLAYVRYLRGKDVAFFDRGVELGPETRRAGDTVEIPFKGGKGETRGEKRRSQ